MKGHRDNGTWRDKMWTRSPSPLPPTPTRVPFLDLVWNRPAANRCLLYITHSEILVFFFLFLLNYFNSFHEHLLRARSPLASEALREIERTRSTLGDLWLQLPWPLMLQSASYSLVFSFQDHPIGLVLPMKTYEILKLSPIFQTSLCVWVFHFINVYI